MNFIEKFNGYKKKKIFFALIAALIIQYVFCLQSG